MDTGPLGREIESALDEVRVLMPDLMPDAYQIERGSTRVPDGSGGYTETPDIVESGSCALAIAGRLGSEGINGAVVLATSSYTAELPLSTTLVETDILIVNGRRFGVTAVKRGGEWELAILAELEART